jgi:uncharacterized damage-inducible protein DinB
VDIILDEVIAILTRTPRVLDAQLRGLDDAWLAANEGEGTWNPRNVVGHLIDCEELNWIPRARIILAQGPGRQFEPFDRYRHLSRTMPINDLLETYAELRAANLDTLRSWRLGPQQLALTGEHPEFGTVTLGQLLAAWVVHDLNHLYQVERVLAVRYREAVGPWKAYLSILKPRA